MQHLVIPVSCNERPPSGMLSAFHKKLYRCKAVRIEYFAARILCRLSYWVPVFNWQCSSIHYRVVRNKL